MGPNETNLGFNQVQQGLTDKKRVLRVLKKEFIQVDMSCFVYAYGVHKLLVSQSVRMAEKCSGARRKQHVRKKLDKKAKEDNDDGSVVGQITKTVTKTRFAFSCVGNQGVVNYGACHMTFPLNRRPGIFGVYMLLLKRLPELLVLMLAFQRSRFKFNVMMKLISVENPDVKQNCFEGVVMLLTKMNEKAEALGGVVVVEGDDEKGLQTKINLTTATFDDLMMYLGTCRKICDQCNTWLSLFWVTRDLISDYQDYDDLPPRSTGFIVSDGFNKTYSTLSNLLEHELRKYEFTVAGATYECGLRK